MTVGLREVDTWVRAEMAAGRQAGMVDIGDVRPHPTRELIACTISIREDPESELVRRTALVDLETGRSTELDLGAPPAGPAVWAENGTLAVLVAPEGEPPTVWLVDADEPGSVRIAHRLPEVDGAVEVVSWSPDGERLLVIVAELGAEVSDVYGSGTIQGPETSQSWQPTVSPAPEAGRRILHVWTPALGTIQRVCPDLNVWEAGWRGPDRLVALASEGAGEGAWYAACVYAMGLDGELERLHRSEVQLAQPQGSPSGRHWSAIEARASDRGLLAGDLVVGGADGPARRVPTAGVDVTAQEWADEHIVAFAGIRGLDTVFGTVDVTTGEVEELLSTDGSSGLYQPDLVARTPSGALIAVLERHDLPPTLTAIRGNDRRELLSTAGVGTAHVVECSGRTTVHTWTSKDGREIHGILTAPDHDGPHPLVVNVHGGPVAAWRDGWIGKDPYAALLVARGFAVLRPNPRGSAGRGQDFIEAIVEDMGGLDVDDIVGGVEAMITSGVTQAGRVGITGNSYGGYMAAWIPCVSDVFAASVSRSPVTDFRLQHLTGNLAEFDEIFVAGDPFDPESQYATRSPLNAYRRIDTPMLFTAGANDLATPPSQAQVLHRALRKTGVPTELVIYPEEGHGVRSPDALTDQIARMIAWFETYLKVDRNGGEG